MPHSCALDLLTSPADLTQRERARSFQAVSLEVNQSLAFAPDLLERRFHTIVDADEGEDELEEGLF